MPQPQLLANDDAKTPVESIFHKTSATTPAKNDMRKPMTTDAQGNEVPVTATPAAAPEMVARPPLDAAQLAALPSTPAPTAPASTGATNSSQIAGDLSSTAKPAGVALKAAHDGVSRPVSNDAIATANAVALRCRTRRRVRLRLTAMGRSQQCSTPQCRSTW